MDGWKIVEALATSTTAIVAGGALIYGALTFQKSRLQNKTAFLAKYFSEYRSVEMGRAVDELWALHDNFTRDGVADKEAMVREYVARSKQYGARFHFEVRRRVSHFYQQMGFLADEDRELRKLMFDVWGPGDLEIIRDVILPLELRAVPLVRRKPVKHPWPHVSANGEIIIQSDWPPSMCVMAKLFNRALLRGKEPKSRTRWLPLLVLVLTTLVVGYVILLT